MMRVQDVLQKELPFQISKEFSTIKKDDQFSAAECPMSITACTHQVKWTALFDQMDETLHEEMNHLVSLIGFSFTAWCSKRTSQSLGDSQNCELYACLFEMIYFNDDDLKLGRCEMKNTLGLKAY